MIIRIARDGTVLLEDARQFRKFSVAVDAPVSAFDTVEGRHPDVLRFTEPGTAFVSIAALRTWEDMRNDAAWQAGLSAMIAAAAPHGWIDEASQSIRAHVVWEDVEAG